MSEHLKANEEGATYFVTLTTVSWVDVFTRKEYLEILFASLEYCRKHKGLELFHYVAMPSHVHMILRRRKGLLSDLLRDFKSYTAKVLLQAIAAHPTESRREWMLELFARAAKGSAQNTHQMFWQKSSHPEEIRSEGFLAQKAEYIRMNPVAAGLVTEPEHYAWSSAHEHPILVPDDL